jgi:hypothetical protein
MGLMVKDGRTRGEDNLQNDRKCDTLVMQEGSLLRTWFAFWGLFCGVGWDY